MKCNKSFLVKRSLSETFKIFREDDPVEILTQKQPYHYLLVRVEI